jgi:macrolide-specific efflux system membrane fusion protein
MKAASLVRHFTGAQWRYLRMNRLSLFILIISILAVIGLFFSFNDRKPRPSLALPSASVEVGDIAHIVQATGQLVPRLKVDIGAQVSGQVRKVHVQLGQSVEKGTLLVTLYSDTSENAVQQAKAALAQQAATTKRARIELRAAEREASRQDRLLAGDATTAFDKEKAETDLAKLEAAQQIEYATLEQRRADLVDKQLKLTFTRVSAPISGEVVAIAVQEGQTVNALQMAPTLLTLAQLNTMTVKARVAEAEIGLVKTAQVARVTTLATNARRYEGKVRVIQPIPERIGNALFYNVLFDIDNADHQLLSEMTVKVELEVARARQVPTIPIVALNQRNTDGSYAVQVLDVNGRASPRQVRTGILNDTHAQIIDGLKPGERVLLAPPDGATSPTT